MQLGSEPARQELGVVAFEREQRAVCACKLHLPNRSTIWRAERGQKLTEVFEVEVDELRQGAVERTGFVVDLLIGAEKWREAVLREADIGDTADEVVCLYLGGEGESIDLVAELGGEAEERRGLGGWCVERHVVRFFGMMRFELAVWRLRVLRCVGECSNVGFPWWRKVGGASSRFDTHARAQGR